MWDAGTADGGAWDAGAADGGAWDAGAADGGAWDAGCAPACSAPPWCSSGDWCWVNPRPQGRSVLSVSAQTGTDAWAVGANGLAMRLDGATWRSEESGTDRSLYASWFAASNDGWVAGEAATLRRWNGVSFGAWPSPRDGWSGAFRGLWGESSSRVFVVGDEGVVMSFDGTLWTEETSGTTQGLSAVHGGLGGEVWAVGKKGTLLRRAVGAWVPVPAPAPHATTNFTAVYVRSSTEVWVAGYFGALLKWDGAAWQSVNLGTTYSLNAVFGGSGQDVWVAGFGGTLRRWDGAAWENVGVALPNVYKLLALRAGAAASDVLFVVGDSGAVLRREQGTWRFDSSYLLSNNGAKPTDRVTSLWGAEAKDVWLMPLSLRWNGADFSPLHTVSFAPLAVHGTAVGDVWAVGGAGKVAHFDGRWTLDQLAVDGGVPQTLHDVWALSAQSAVAVGEGPHAWHWEGMAWSARPLPGGPYFGVWGSAPGDLWAVGAGGQIAHWNGSDWTQTSSGTSAVLRDVHGTGALDVWAVGESGTVLRWEGAGWQQVATPLQGTALGLWAVRRAGAQEVWAAGDEGAVLHWDGSNWQLQKPGAGTLSALFVAGPHEVWVGGSGGFVLRRRPLP